MTTPLPYHWIGIELSLSSVPHDSLVHHRWQAVGRVKYKGGLSTYHACGPTPEAALATLLRGTTGGIEALCVDADRQTHEVVSKCLDQHREAQQQQPHQPATPKPSPF